MSNVILKEGWVVDNPRISSDLIRATIPQKDNLGRTIPVVVISNIKTGNFDVYEVPTIQLAGSTIPIPNAPLGTPLFRYDATNDRPVPVSRDIPSLKSLYGDANGQNQLNNLITSVKRSTYENARLNTGTDPIRNQNFENIKNKKGYQSIANTAPRPSSPPPQSGTGTPPTPTSGQNPEGTPAPSESTEGSTSTEIGNKIDLPPPLTISPGPIKYPERMSDDQDKIYFQAVKLKSNDRKINENTSPNSLQFGFGVPEYELINDGPVVMAIQSSISDQNTVEWNPGSINAAEAALYNLSLGGMKTPIKQVGNATKQTVDSILEVVKANEPLIQRYVAGLAAGVNNILPRTDGVVLNPNLELLFQGPQLRPFNFQFKMSARDEQEAKNIKSIIKYFKYHMAVRKDERDLFLRAPHVFTIRYTKGNTENHPGINLISPSNVKRACALLNCSVDYTPLGSYMTYREGTMVSYNLSLQFQEITPIYNTDYEEEPGNTHQIGF